MLMANVEEVSRAFRAALRECIALSPSLKLKYPDLYFVLCQYYGHDFGGRLKIHDSYSKDTDKELEVLFGAAHKRGLKIKYIEGNREFHIGGGLKEKIYAKLYCCLKSEKAAEFTGFFLNWLEKMPSLSFSGKFYEIHEPDSHGKLLFYISFDQLPKLVNFLSSMPQFFHPVEMNHWLGIHLFPGVSVVIASEKHGASFDYAVTKVIMHWEDIIEIDRIPLTAQTRAENALLEFKENEVTKYHFDFLIRIRSELRRPSPGPDHWLDTFDKQ